MVPPSPNWKSFAFRFALLQNKKLKKKKHVFVFLLFFGERSGLSWKEQGAGHGDFLTEISSSPNSNIGVRSGPETFQYFRIQMFWTPLSGKILQLHKNSHIRKNKTWKNVFFVFDCRFRDFVFRDFCVSFFFVVNVLCARRGPKHLNT